MSDYSKETVRRLNGVQRNCLKYLKENLEVGNFGRVMRLNYANGKLPDYTDAIQTSFYMLKYAKFYMFEYYLMYDLAIRNLAIMGYGQTHKNPYVISFGSGSGVDALALKYALYKYQNQPKLSEYEKVTHCYYTGLDKCNWPEISKPDLNHLDFDLVRNVNANIADISEGYLKYANVLFFPKVLSELGDTEDGPSQVIDSICEKIRNTSLNKDIVAICASYRGERNMYENVRLQKVVDAYKEKGYEVVKTIVPANWAGLHLLDRGKDSIFTVSEKEKNTNLWKFDDFIIDPEIWEYLGAKGEIRKKCPEFKYVTDTNTKCGDVCWEKCKYSNDCGLRPIPRVRLYSEEIQTCFRIVMLCKKRPVSSIPVVTYVSKIN